jgi:hypothetical protein
MYNTLALALLMHARTCHVTIDIKHEVGSLSFLRFSTHVFTTKSWDRSFECAFVACVNIHTYIYLYHFVCMFVCLFVCMRVCACVCVTDAINDGDA